ncbi:10866_t:CDS:10, partial [Paraglomus occultum]
IFDGDPGVVEPFTTFYFTAKSMTKSKKNSGLGRAIIRDRFKNGTRPRDGDTTLHTTDLNDGSSWTRLQSVTQQRDLDEFLDTAQLAGHSFAAERQNVKIVTNAYQNPFLLTTDKEKEVITRHEENRDKLTIPRRPKWTKSTTPEQLEIDEREAFLNWRRGLAYLQEMEDFLLTPFERNIEVWRQLWRVIERSDLVVQIVDARNPLFFRSSDLERYVNEVDEKKKNLLLINKADLLTAEQRNKIYILFGINGKREPTPLQKEVHICDTSDLILLLSSEVKDFLINSQKATIGLVGYPNVGKSSTINSLLGEKRVSISATPGKTKHFQTIHLTPSLVLCDCPGLVFPNFATTNAEMVCNGVLPIDQMREHTGPVALVARRIPKEILQAIYGITIKTRSEEEGGDNIPTAEELLSAYAVARGLTTSGYGAPDEPRAARYILKDYVNGKLPYCHPPPIDITPEEFNSKLHDPRLYFKSRKDTTVQQSESTVNSVSTSTLDQTSDKVKAIDKSFFSTTTAGAHATGRNFGQREFTRADAYPIYGRIANDGNVLTDTAQAPTAKNLGKRHHKKGKGGKNRKENPYGV